MNRTLSNPKTYVIFAVVLIVLIYQLLSTRSLPASSVLDRGDSDKEVIVAALKKDDVSWLHQYLPEWKPRIYRVDATDRQGVLTVPRNKGREANVYLTYIIDNYYHLPEHMVFIHSLRYQWHNEDPMYDGVPVLKNLQLPYLSKIGFLPLRCTWSIGCPTELHPLEPDGRRQDDRTETESTYASAFTQLFPNTTVPQQVGTPCGGQFGLSRSKVLERPLSDYEHYRQWLWDTTLPDNISGRILEYSWHIMFGKPAQNCPPAAECFCNVFGLCNLECKTAASCEKRYMLPRYSQIPIGWPENGAGQNGFPSIGWAD